MLDESLCISRYTPVVTIYTVESPQHREIQNNIFFIRNSR